MLRMKLFKAMKKKYYLNFFFLSPFKMDSFLLCYCILISVVANYSFKKQTNLGKSENTERAENTSEVM